MRGRKGFQDEARFPMRLGGVFQKGAKGMWRESAGEISSTNLNPAIKLGLCTYYGSRQPEQFL